MSNSSKTTVVVSNIIQFEKSSEKGNDRAKIVGLHNVDNSKKIVLSILNVIN